MRPTIWVFIGLVAASGCASWAFAAGAPAEPYLAIALWGAVAIGTIIRIISAARGHKVKTAAQPVADGMETWESLYLNRRPPRVQTLEAPTVTVSEVADEPSSGIDLDRKRARI